MTINAKDLKSIKADLAQRRKARLAAADDRDLSIKETILRLAPELRRMKRQGFTTTELVEVLKGHGLGIKGATLNRYLAENQPPKAKTGNGQSQNNAEATTKTLPMTAKTPKDASATTLPAKTPSSSSAPRQRDECSCEATPLISMS